MVNSKAWGFISIRSYIRIFLASANLTKIWTVATKSKGPEFLGKYKGGALKVWYSETNHQTSNSRSPSTYGGAGKFELDKNTIIYPMFFNKKPLKIQNKLKWKASRHFMINFHI
jgi:hypothetical protein